MARSRILNKIVYDIEDFLNILIESFYTMYQIAIARNPCKKCLVRPCCRKICSKKEYYIRLMLGHDSMIFGKCVAYFCFGSLIISSISLIVTIFE
jgi:hypothetical protein